MPAPEFKLQRFRGGWAISTYLDGRRISRKSLAGRDAPAAAAEFNRIVAELKKPVDPDVTALWTAYRDDKAGRRIADNMEWSGRAILPYFGAMKPEDITPKVCRAYTATRRLKGRKNGTIRTELNQLRIVMTWAKKAKMIGQVPAFELPPSPAPKERHLTRDEFDALLEASETYHLRVFLILAISTAARVTALLELTWQQVDFDRGLIYLGRRNTLRPSKGRATVPMTDAARAALSAAKALALTDHVIEWNGAAVSSVRTALSKAAERAGVAGVTPHVLRHSSAVWMSEAGVPMAAIAQFLGHADSNITERVYSRFSPEYLSEAAGALEVCAKPYLASRNTKPTS